MQPVNGKEVCTPEGWQRAPNTQIFPLLKLGQSAQCKTQNIQKGFANHGQCGVRKLCWKCSRGVFTCPDGRKFYSKKKAELAGYVENQVAWWWGSGGARPVLFLSLSLCSLPLSFLGCVCWCPRSWLGWCPMSHVSVRWDVTRIRAEKGKHLLSDILWNACNCEAPCRIALVAKYIESGVLRWM